MIEMAKNYLLWIYNTWNFIVYQWIPNNVPDVLLIHGTKHWQVDILVGAMWIGIYAGFAWLYFKVISKPVYKLIGYLHQYNMKVLPWWHALIYIFLIVSKGFGAPMIYLTKSKFDLTPFIALLPILIYYLVKARWRIVLIPFILAVVYAFWLGAIFVFFPVVLLWGVLLILGVGASTLTETTRYRCPNCNQEVNHGSNCPYCGTVLEW